MLGNTLPIVQAAGRSKEEVIKLRKGSVDHMPFHKGKRGKNWRDEKCLGLQDPVWMGIQPHVANASPSGLAWIYLLTPKGN